LVGKEALLFWRKEAKNFFTLGHRRVGNPVIASGAKQSIYVLRDNKMDWSIAPQQPGSRVQKSFCAAFFKKRPLPLRKASRPA
jgi:hypothetical protein